jgi:hypothetical protein
MALRLRRGTNAERTTVTFAEGELIYVTDHVAQSVAPLWVGDGVTLGGRTADTHIAGTIGALQDVDITGITNDQVLKWVAANSRFEPVDISQLNQGATQLDDLTDVDLVSVAPNAFSANVLKYNGTQFVPSQLALDDMLGVFYVDQPKKGDFLIHDGYNFIPSPIEQQNWKINIVGDDSTIIINTDTNNVTGNFFGDLVGDTTGIHSGTVNGDVNGSVFGDDSSLLVDGVNNVFTGDIRSARLTVSKPEQPGDGLNGGIGEVNIDVFSNDNRSLLNLRRRTTDDLTGNTDVIYGTVTFGRDDVNGLKTTGIIFGRENSIYFGVAPDGAFNAADKFFVWRDYKLGIGLTSPAEALDVNGNANVSGTVTAAGFVGSVFADDSATIVDGITGSVTAQSFVQFGSLTSTERNDLTAANGMVIYNTTNNKFEGYQNSVWINLDDGSPAS